MATAVQLNTRIDAMLKQSGDAVFARNGYTPSEAVRALWRYAAEHQAVPSFMDANVSAEDAQDVSSAASRAADGVGLALRVASEACGYQHPGSSQPAQSYEETRAWMYDCMLAEMEERCR